MQRRNFLAGMLALGAAPAIVRASSLMKIVVPNQDIWIRGDEFLTINQPNDLMSELRAEGWVANVILTPEVGARFNLDGTVDKDAKMLLQYYARDKEPWLVNRDLKKVRRVITVAEAELVRDKLFNREQNMSILISNSSVIGLGSIDMVRL